MFKIIEENMHKINDVLKGANYAWTKSCAKCTPFVHAHVISAAGKSQSTIYKNHKHESSRILLGKALAVGSYG